MTSTFLCLLYRSVKTGIFQLMDLCDATEGDNVTDPKGSVDVFGQAISTTSGVPALKKQPECICPNCQRNLAASRFAPHLEKCMGMGRNSSRLASRRYSTKSTFFLKLNGMLRHILGRVEGGHFLQHILRPLLSFCLLSSQSLRGRKL